VKQSEKEKAVEVAVEAIHKQFGAASIISLGDDAAIEKVEVIPTGSVGLDVATGVGGYPRGRIVELSGPESGGKTTMALHAVAEAQKLGGIAAYVDAEHSLDVRYAAAIGVNVDKLWLSQPDYGEQALEIVEALARSAGVDVIVVDSVAALTPKSEIEGEMGDATMGVQARLMSQAMRKLTAVLHRTGTLLIFINQLRCIAENEWIFTERGLTRANFADAKKDKLIVGGKGTLTPIGASAFSRQPGVRVVDDAGHSCVAGFKHPFLRMREDGRPEWVPVAELAPGDWVAVAREVELADVRFDAAPEIDAPTPRENPVSLPKVLDENFCAFLGMWFSDGSLIPDGNTSGWVGFTEVSEERRSLVVDLGLRLGLEPVSFGSCGVRFGSRVFRLLVSLNCQRGGANKTVPACITGRQQWRAFLRGMFDSHPVSHGFMLTVENYEAARQIQLALLGFGIQSRARPNRYDTTYIYVSGRDALRYLSTIGFLEETKALRVACAVGEPDESGRGKNDVIPYPSSFIQQARESACWKNLPEDVRARVASVLCAGLNLAVRDYRLVADVCQQEDLVSHYSWRRVIQLDFVRSPEIPMLDFDVPNTESFIAGGFITHNTKIGVMFGNPETTTGGNALKFYASMRLDVRRLGSATKEGEVVVASHTRVKVIKNKVAAPFREAEFDIRYGVGIDSVGEILDAAVAASIIEKSGSWFSYGGERIGQGREAAATRLRGSPKELAEVKEQVRLLLGQRPAPTPGQDAASAKAEE
jgi:RecA/RadA recombinase